MKNKRSYIEKLLIEKMLVFFVLENPLKFLHKNFVYRTLKENFELDDKTLGYDFRLESFFPTSWGSILYLINGISHIHYNYPPSNGFWGFEGGGYPQDF